MPNVGPKCPDCSKTTTFTGVEQSWFRNAWIEAYQCLQHGHRFEGPIKKNKHDRDFNKPPFEGNN